MSGEELPITPEPHNPTRMQRLGGVALNFFGRIMDHDWMQTTDLPTAQAAEIPYDVGSVSGMAELDRIQAKAQGDARRLALTMEVHPYVT